MTDLESIQLVVNHTTRLLSTVEEQVLALGKYFAIMPRCIPHGEIIAVMEALMHRLDQKMTDTLRLKPGVALQHTKLPKPYFPPINTVPYKTCGKIKAIIVPADEGRATVILNKEYIQKMR